MFLGNTFLVKIGLQSTLDVTSFCQGSEYQSEIYRTITKKSQLVSVTRGLAAWLVSRQEGIIKTLKHVWCCDEIMLQTYVPISPFAENISALGNLRKIDWTRGTPYVWRNEDFDELMRSDALFARKFSLTDEPEIIHRIIEKLK